MSPLFLFILWMVSVNGIIDCHVRFGQHEILYDKADTLHTLQWVANPESVDVSYRIANETGLCAQGDCYLMYGVSNGSSSSSQATLTTQPGIIDTNGFINIHVIFSVMALGSHNGSCDMRYSVDNFKSSNKLIYSQFAFYAYPTQHTIVTAPFGADADDNSKIQLRLITNVNDANLCVFDELRICGDYVIESETILETIGNDDEMRQILYVWRYKMMTIKVSHRDSVYYVWLDVKSSVIYVLVAGACFVLCFIGLFVQYPKIKRYYSRSRRQHDFNRQSFAIYM